MWAPLLNQAKAPRDESVIIALVVTVGLLVQVFVPATGRFFEHFRHTVKAQPQMQHLPGIHLAGSDRHNQSGPSPGSVNAVMPWARRDRWAEMMALRCSFIVRGGMASLMTPTAAS